jgi:hypothetical protein
VSHDATLIATASTFSPSPAMNHDKETPSKYPNETEITKIFDPIGEGNFMAFFAHVVPSVS